MRKAKTETKKTDVKVKYRKKLTTKNYFYVEDKSGHSWIEYEED